MKPRDTALRLKRFEVAEKARKVGSSGRPGSPRRSRAAVSWLSGKPCARASRDSGRALLRATLAACSGSLRAVRG